MHIRTDIRIIKFRLDLTFWSKDLKNSDLRNNSGYKNSFLLFESDVESIISIKFINFIRKLMNSFVIKRSMLKFSYFKNS
ncbi:hypothetical protein BpHYR1_052382 [Brachionus plicatilis]|uniref:Uncharacterized protein n=1 Tax=Brachionus plicatilis TaxID=10195 RepID=A0A3M7RV57_BRAPC|nr:hypothetical protein BpHYR1_052382 [Brachionus plicatilis]